MHKPIRMQFYENADRPLLYVEVLNRNCLYRNGKDYICM